MRKEPPINDNRTRSGARPGYFLRLGDSAIPIGSPGLEIGRSPRCDVTLEDGLASRRHARVAISERGVTVEDLGSANGVFVNGERVTGTRLLQIGDVLLIGRTKLARVGSR